MHLRTERTLEILDECSGKEASITDWSGKDMDRQFFLRVKWFEARGQHVRAQLERDRAADFLFSFHSNFSRVVALDALLWDGGEDLCNEDFLFRDSLQWME